MDHNLLGIGLTGKSLTDLERAILRENTPYAVVLFGRNVGDARQLRELVAEVRAISARPPLFMIDEEGGRVDRLRNLIPGLPNAEAYGEGERPSELASWGGNVIGAALRYFDIEVDLAPVVDICTGESPKGLERRMFGRNVETVLDLAGSFMRGLHSAGTASCLKHFPGIGGGSADPHHGATVIDIPFDALAARDLVPFARLGRESGAIMVGHGTYPQIDQPDLPATLSRVVASTLLRETAAFDGLAITDDMEMHAVADHGSYESIAERALMAGNDVVMFCSHIERVPDIQRSLERRARETASLRVRIEEASRRAERYRQHIDQLRRAALPPAARFEEIADQAARFADAFQAARQAEADPPMPRTGPTGREEWT